ncbi:MAG: 3-hydroxyisobutyrate dehydrogenase [Frankiaceae bacterium]|jgi:3-hydroxyisobutyrate dehydrogenase-like beta-hydroxyacid dehydrogenase|nr:3-hydroxyisobutyrate dehydrogenase [Frankiaceae bacterium]MDQ1633831.1 3-hydroxyisobutyrate dehydrogenase [Frankiaceae bacterium]
MARHLLDAGHDLTVWNRTSGKAGELVEAGATEASTVGEAVGNAEIVVLMLFGPDSVRDVLKEVGEAAGKGTLVLDSTTIGRDAAEEFGKLADGLGLRYVDAPVVGTTAPARNGTLGVLVGATDEDFATVKPLLETWGDPEKIRHVGPVASGNALKTVVNLTLGVAMGGVAEALRLGRDLHIDSDVLLATLGQGPLGFSVNQKKDMLASGDFQPTAFSLDLLLKDLTIALDVASDDLPLTKATAAYADAAIAAGHGDDDYTALAGYFAFEGSADSY